MQERTQASERAKGKERKKQEGGQAAGVPSPLVKGGSAERREEKEWADEVERTVCEALQDLDFSPPFLRSWFITTT